jgi:hypothetical protein
LPHATLARRVVLIPATVTVLRVPQFTSVPICLMRFLFRHVTVAWRDTFLQAAANFRRDPWFPRFSSLGYIPCPFHHPWLNHSNYSWWR